MWITTLQLSNIKSYGPDTPAIRFQPGVNLIQGRNGAGKSTILEAIGLALFDSKPYTLGQFVREGERAGKITVGFISALDEREYEVVRQVGGSSQSYVYDPEVDRKLCEGREDTLAFVRQHLNLDAETNLTTLFEDAIGVPQGTMTAAFRERPADRKQKFNRLLQIDMYERAWNELLQTGNYIKELIAANTEEQSTLRGMLHDQPAVEAQAQEQQDAIAAMQARLIRVQEDLSQISAMVTAGEALKGQLDELDGRLSTARGALSQGQLRLEQAQEAHAEAVQAASVVEETRAAQEAYALARQGLEAAEADRQARDQLRTALSDLETRQGIARQALKQLDKDLAEVAEAEAELATLAPRVAEQTALGHALATARKAGEEHTRLAAQIARQRERLDQQGQRFDALLEAVGAALGAPDPLPAPDLSQSLEELTLLAVDRVGELGRVRDRWEQKAQALWDARQALETIQAQVEARVTVERDREAAVATLRDLETQANAQRLRYSQAQSELEQLGEHEALLSATGATCPVCRQPVDDHAQAEAQAHYRAERARLTSQREEADGLLGALEEQVRTAEGQRDGLETRLQKLPSAAALDEAQSREAQAAEALDEEIAALKAAVHHCRVTLAAAEAQHQHEVERLAALAQQAGDETSLMAQLADLGDPLTAQTRARLVADRRAGLEETHTKTLAEVAGLADEQAQLEQRAAQFAGLNAQLEALRQQISEHEADHTRYLSHVTLAEQVAARQQAVEVLTMDVTAQVTALKGLEDERDGLAGGYDAAQHQQDREAQRTLELEAARLQTQLEGAQATLAAQQARLTAMEIHAQALSQAEAAAQRLATRQAAAEFVRQTVREAGPRITRQLVGAISEQANHLFGDLLGDHSYILSWSEEYGISVNSRGEVRDFELLSGGEQMVAAMAVRLALLTHLTNVRFAFFDEPTTNLDDARRSQLAASLAEIQSLRQMFVISHDDTFEQESYHVIQVYKEQDLSQVEML